MAVTTSNIIIQRRKEKAVGRSPLPRAKSDAAKKHLERMTQLFLMPVVYTASKMRCDDVTTMDDPPRRRDDGDDAIGWFDLEQRTGRDHFRISIVVRVGKLASFLL